MVVLPKTTRDIGEHLSQLPTQDKKITGNFFKILQNVQFLALQKNLLLQGDDNSNNNFLQILKQRGIEDSRIAQ